MNLYEKYCLPHCINCLCGLGAITSQRQKVVPLATGRVLEIGMGAALNLPYYNSDQVEFIWGLEPSAEMRKAARKNLQAAAIQVQWLSSPAAEVPLEDGVADTVLLTFTLCTLPDWKGALGEMRRVLKPDGRLIFCEHGEAPDESIRNWQNRINPLWKRVSGGCHLNRPIPDYLEQGGFQITTMESGYMPGVPRIAGFNYWGVARKG
ncbi:MAG: class I SAM-dependent methyltransferase [Trichloromonadaceae bacterium]